MDILKIFDWKAIVALLALILSQLPPIRQMIKEKRKKRGQIYFRKTL